MRREIKTTLALDGEKAYKAGMADVNRELRVLNSEMKAATAAYGDNQKSIEALTAKSNVLTKQIEQQRVKVESLTGAVSESARINGEANKKTDGYRIQLNGAKAALSEMENELNQVNASLKKSNDGWTRAGTTLTDASKKYKDIGGKISDVGGKLTAGLTGPIVAATAGIAIFTAKALTAADALQQTADVTGITTERLQELTYVGTMLDVDLKTITESQSRLIRSMNSAAQGTKQQADAFKELGVNVKNGNGQLRSSNDVFDEVIDKLGTMANETERDALTMVLFGKSAMDLNPLIKAGSSEIARLTTEARKNGAVMSGDAVQALDAFGDELEAAKLSLNTSVMSIVSGMLPALQRMLPLVQDKVVPAVAKFAEVTASLVEGFLELSPAAQGAIITTVALAAAIGPVLTGIGSLITSIGTLQTFLGTVSTAIAGAGGAMAILTGPVGLAVIGTLAATAGLIALVSSRADEATDRVNAMATALDATAKSFDEQIAQIRAETMTAGELADQLYDLSDKENKSNDEKARMASLVAQLNQLIPDLNLSINQQTGALTQQKQAISDLIAERKKQLQQQAVDAYLLELYTKQVKLADEVTAAEKRHRIELEKFNKDMATTGQEYLKSLNYLNASNDALKENTERINQAELASQNLRVGLDRLASSSSNIAYSTKAATMAYREMGGGITATNEAVIQSGQRLTFEQQQQLARQAADARAAQLQFLADYDAIEQQKIANAKARDDQEKALEEKRLQEIREYNAAVEQTTQQHMDQMGGLDQKTIERLHLHAKDVKINLDKQVAAFDGWRKGIKRLAGKGMDDVLAELEKLGPGADQIIDDLNKMTPAQREAFANSWRAKGKVAADAAKDELGTLPGASEAIATDSGNKVAAGLASTEKTVAASSTKLAVAAKSELKYLPAQLKNLGFQAGNGLADGLDQARINVIGAAKRIAESARNTVRVTLEIRSPSRVLRALGQMTGAGFSLGLDDMATRVASSAAYMARMAQPGIGRFALGSPALAGAGGGGGSSSSVTNHNYNISVGVSGSFTVRSDADIAAVSKGLARETVNLLRAKGVQG